MASEYGRKLVEAAARAVAAESGPLLPGRYDNVKSWVSASPEEASSANREGCRAYIEKWDRQSRAALLAFLDALIEQGPSEGMLRQYVREIIGVDPDGMSGDTDMFTMYAHDARSAFADVVCMLRALRTEIARAEESETK